MTRNKPTNDTLMSVLTLITCLTVAMTRTCHIFVYGLSWSALCLVLLVQICHSILDFVKCHANISIFTNHRLSCFGYGLAFLFLPNLLPPSFHKRTILLSAIPRACWEMPDLPKLKRGMTYLNSGLGARRKISLFYVRFD